MARASLWLAVIMPFIFTTAKTAADITGGGGVGLLEMVRGGGPAALWMLSILLAPPVRKGFGATELALTGFCVMAVLSFELPTNPDPQGTLLKAASTAFVFLAMGRLVRLYPDSTHVVRALITLTHAILLGAGLEYVLLRSHVYTVSVQTTDDLPRLNMLFPNISANPLALVAVGGILACVLGLGPRWLPMNIFVRTPLLALYLFEIILTRTRSGVAIGLLIIALAVLARLRRRPLSTVGILVVVVAAAFVLLPLFGTDVSSFVKRGQSSQQLNTLTGRTVVWKLALHVWQQNQTFGLGYYSGHRLGIPGLQAGQSNIDNTWLESLVDVGIVGTALLAIFVVIGLIRLFRKNALVGDIRLWAIGMAVYTVPISFINPTIQTPGAAQIVLGVLLLMPGASRLSSRVAPAPGNRTVGVPPPPGSDSSTPSPFLAARSEPRIP